MSNQVSQTERTPKNLEFSRIQFNLSKLKNEDRVLNLILKRVGFKKQMGAEVALEDTVTFLRKWKTSIKEWRKLSKIILIFGIANISTMVLMP